MQGYKVAGKAWVALIGSLLTFIVPAVLQISAGLPAPWPAVIGAVVAVLTSVGVYHAPYQPVSKGGTPCPGANTNTPWPQG